MPINSILGGHGILSIPVVEMTLQQFDKRELVLVRFVQKCFFFIFLYIILDIKKKQF